MFKNKMAVLGEPWTVWGFAGLGISVYPADNPKDALSVLKSIEKDYAMIFVSETFLEVVRGKLELERKDRFPIICLIPNNKERKHSGRELIQEIVRKAVGFEI